MLFTDASGRSIGAMLAQEDDKQVRPIGHFSKTLSKPERLWSCADRELLGIIMGLKNWYGLLRHTKVVVYSDSLCAKYILA